MEVSNHIKSLESVMRLTTESVHAQLCCPENMNQCVAVLLFLSFLCSRNWQSVKKLGHNLFFSFLVSFTIFSYSSSARAAFLAAGQEATGLTPSVCVRMCVRAFVSCVCARNGALASPSFSF